MSRRRPNFSTRTAQEDVARLDPNDAGDGGSGDRGRFLQWPPVIWSRPQESTPEESQRDSRHGHPFAGLSRWWGKNTQDDQGQENQRERVVPHMPLSGAPLRDTSADKKVHWPRSTDEPKKLGTFSGVFVPTTLNVLSILMFLRFGFILGQAGLLGILGISRPVPYSRTMAD